VNEVVEGSGEDGADGVVAVEADTVAVSGENEEEVEGELVSGEELEEAVAKESVRDEGEALPSDTADSVREDRGSEDVEPSIGLGVPGSFR
jgi:hypothetical protein